MVIYNTFAEAKLKSATADCPVSCLDQNKQRIKGFLKNDPDFGQVISESLSLNTVYYDPNTTVCDVKLLEGIPMQSDC